MKAMILMKRIILPGLSIALLIASCMRPSRAADGTSISLASFTENDVAVTIQLDHDRQEGSFLSATFTPPEGYHLYSKDIPINGLNGLGRPTRLELLSESHIRVVGELTESAKAGVPDFEPKELLVYPAGAVTLSLKIDLPPGRDWFNDAVSVTYMACSDVLCFPPVEGKVVPIRVPGADVLDDQ